MFSVELLNRGKSPVNYQVDFAVGRFSMDAIGGPVAAELQATGPRAALLHLRAMLGYYIRIRNRNNTPVWWGMIEGATIDVDGLTVGVALSAFRNRVNVQYSIPDGYGGAIEATTGWDQHDQSVVIYGQRELLFAGGELEPAEASAVQARELDKNGLPRQSIEIGQSGDGATIRCIGLWSTLAWTYYTNRAGREVFNVTPNAEQSLGWGFTASDVGFADRALHRLAGGLTGPQAGEVIRVSGSASNDGTHVTENSVDGKVASYTATTISFDPVDDINDSAAGLGFVRRGTYIQVAGSSAEDGYHLIDSEGRDHIVVDDTVTGTIDAAAAGASVTIAQGETLPLAAEVTTEIPGSSITISSYTKIAYSFTLTDNVPAWPVAELWLPLQIVGDPSDSFSAGIYADASGAPGTLIDSATVSGASLRKTQAWVRFSLANTEALSYGTTYWIQGYRTGANDGNNYYVIGLDEDLQRAAGALKLWNGSAWVSRSVDADLPFQIWGHTDTTDQIATILTSEGQFLSGSDVRTTSGLGRRQYRDGSTDALYEIEKLMDAGSGGVALLSTISPDWHAIIDTAPTNSSNVTAVLRRGPELVTPSGKPLEEGLLPVGKWCAVDGVDDGASGLAPLSPFLIGFMEYDAQQERVTDLQPFGTDGPFVFGVTQG